MVERNEDFYFPQYSYKQIESAYMPSMAYVSLIQDEQTLCTPIVGIGDIVQEGQIIATHKASGITIHSPIPGTVHSLEERTMPNGTNAECIVIQLQGSFTYTGKETKNRSWKYDTSSRIVSQIRQQGIINTVDTKGASLAEQIERLDINKKTLGVLLFDFDPSTSVSKTIIEMYEKEIFEGCSICARAMNADEIVFFCSNKAKNYTENPEIAEILEETKHFFIPVDSSLYPNASPIKLNAFMKKYKQANSLEIAANLGLCIDTTTALSIYRGIVFSLPVTHTYVEVNGPALHESKMFSVKIGTPIRQLLELTGGTEKIPSKIVTNGLLKGKAINDLSIPVTKYLKSISLLSSDTLPDQTQSLCIHCGLCRRSCPAGLLPDVLYSHNVNGFKIHDEIRMSAKFCDECALCNTTCPSRLPLFQTIAQIKEDENATKI